MNGIEKFHQISENALDQRDYFSSLCDNALSLGIFSQNDMQKIQNELYVILAEKADSFTGGKCILQTLPARGHTQAAFGTPQGLCRNTAEYI